MSNVNPSNLFSSVEQSRLLDELPDVVLILDSNFNLLWANLRAEEVFGVKAVDFIGHSVVSRIHPDDLEMAQRSFESMMEREIGNPIEIRAMAGSGWRLFEVLGRNVNWLSEGAVFFTFRDLTDRRRFEISHDDVARFRSLVQHSSAIVFMVSSAGLVQSVSGAITRNLGLDPEFVENRALSAIVAEDDWHILQSAMDRARDDTNATRAVVCCVRFRRHETQELVSYELSIVNLLHDATLGEMVITAYDVSARVATEAELQDTMRELRETFSLLHATLEATADGILVVDSNRHITRFNSQYLRLWHVDESMLLRGDDHLLISAILNQLKEPEAFLARTEALYLATTEESEDTIEFIDGRVFQRYSKPQYIDGEVVGRVWSFIDVTMQKGLESDLEHMAFYDGLTGLANRALFHDHLDHAITRIERNGKYVAVLYLDLDNFKTVNDSLGHTVGDDLLRAVGAALIGCLRRSDMAARLGGDEFAILIEDVENRHEVIHLAQRILSSLREPLAIRSHRVSTTTSIGITFGAAGSTSEQLLRNADLAMYRAKSLGKDRYEEFQDDMHTAVLAHLELEADLRRSLLEEQFVVHYQPIVDLSSKELVGFEALVRWNHPSRGLLAPSEFITRAEEMGIISSIDHFVLNESCRQISQWNALGLIESDLIISVNVSASEVADATLAERVSSVLRDHDFDPSRLVLEITESAIMTNVRGAAVNLRALKDLGLSVAVDDFGTGYSSLTHLGSLPIDILKIDRSFVEVGASDKVQPDLARAIVELAGTLQLRTIAEGVETEHQAEYLLEIGCRWAQGYHLGRPIDASATEILLRQRSEKPL
jgi:diguanylate cyclase (GGDEF)-like protein/PAS domain S-box-containing protein